MAFIQSTNIFRSYMYTKYYRHFYEYCVLAALVLIGPSALWVSGARQYTKKIYTDLTPDLKQKNDGENICH